MPDSPSLSRPVGGLSPLAQELLPVLYRHRLLSTSQLHQLLTPTATSSRYLRRLLGRLRAERLVAATERRTVGRSELLWYATPLGCEIVEAGRELAPRAYRMTEQAAAGQLQEHTLAVNATGLAFVTHARRLGDDCGPLDWDPELAHRIRDGEDRLGDEAFLVPDAVIRYVRSDREQRMLLTFFAEIDRATMSVADLAGKLTRYARYSSYVPQVLVGGRRRTVRTTTREAWRDRYPAFPRILLVLTGAPPAALARRTADLRALAAADGRLHHAAGQLQAGITTLTQLQQHGPFAPIVTPVLGDPVPTDVLMRQPSAAAA
ncbi:replication-relaxation family protein [Streptomyces sp. NPDC050315]|uniref:replication-relaxation family protein n=1 Tax=Streptomyces sp. NPDC050315 TaxID=3155039 RepID=UPI00343A47CD